MALTMLDELEAVDDVALVAAEKQSTTLECRLLCKLLLIEFRTEGNATTYDAAGFSRNGRSQSFQVQTRVRLADVRSEWAAILGLGVIGESIVEVVVPLRVCSEGRIILQGGKINRST